MTKRGIYIVANDKVMDQSVALLNSIRKYDPDTPVILIPFNENYQAVAQRLGKDYDVRVFGDLALLERVSKQLTEIFGSDFFARPNVLRKVACWLGELEEFLYIDTDIVVFDKIIDYLKYFDHYDFLCYDYQYKSGIKNVFSNQVIEDNIFKEDELKDVFNSGFWASKSCLMSEEDLYEILKDCAAHPGYFDFSEKTSDQPILNYIVLKKAERRFNLVNESEKMPGNWGGSSHFREQDHILLDTKNDNKPLKFIHWAGIRLEPGCPYWDTWKYYRYLGETAPSDVEILKQKPKKPPTFLQKIKALLQQK